MNSNQIQDHIFSTYITLRYGMAVIAITFPLAIFLTGKYHGIDLQNSLSAYYWASVNEPAPVRNWFVGGLFALAAFFYLYKGFTHKENSALNLAALFAIGVATKPMKWPEMPNDHSFSVHGICAVLLFICLGYVMLFKSGETLKYIPENIPTNISRERLISRYKAAYRLLGALMILSPAAAVVLSTIIGKPSTTVFFIEAVGVVSFGLFWFIKSSEFELSKATRRALSGVLPTEGESP